MLNEKQLASYAELVVKVGANLQNGQSLWINSPIECHEIARAIAKQAYLAGAYDVHINWSDEKFGRLRIDHASLESLLDIPEWMVKSRERLVEKRMALISISAGDPNNYTGADMQKLQKVTQKTRQAFEMLSNATMSNYCRWCVISVPTINWAKKVFPDASAAQAVNKLWNAISKAMRLNAVDPVAAWRKHNETLKKRAKFLNDHDFEAMKFTSSNGTDLVVGLAEGHIWSGASEHGQDGVEFTANMPTEEVFTAPHKYKVDGVLKSALPLVHNGIVIDKFSITFKKGRVVNFSAEQGFDMLKSLIETDEGSHYLGEIALIGKNSPISKMGILFFNTLFDENASCHLAIGRAYPTTVKNGNNLTNEQLDKLGANYSLEHSDFMIGTKDMNIVGITKKGEKIQIFRDGEWVI